jgi:hypothetical protein
MKVNLMHPEVDFDLDQPLPAHGSSLSQDLGLDILTAAMASSDKLVLASAKRALLVGTTDVSEICYRQQVLTDCLEHPEALRQLYRNAVTAVEDERRVWGLYSGSPLSVLSRAIGAADVLLAHLKELRRTADECAGGFSSEGFVRFFKMVSSELDDEYLAEAEGYVNELRFKTGLLVSGRLGEANALTGFVLRRPGPASPKRRAGPFARGTSSFEVPSNDDAGLRALDDLRARAVNFVANALAQSAEHVRHFFSVLAAELAFYVGCSNLANQLALKGARWCLPKPAPTGKDVLHAEGLYDPGLVLRQRGGVVGNGLRADGKRLVMVTGANQGGKSTLLRAVGLAQLMMQAGMFVPAEKFSANVCPAVFTHFKREEDPTMQRGKLDEELVRMSAIVAELKPGSMLLCNESFASTNEREGSEIARQVVKAMTAGGVKVLFVTHMFELAKGLWDEHLPEALFLRAERLDDGRRTFRLLEGEPLPTSFGRDSYQAVFGSTERN